MSLCVSSKLKEEVEDTTPVDETNEELSSLVNVCDPQQYQQVFQARHRLSKLAVMLSKLGCCVLAIQCRV